MKRCTIFDRLLQGEVILGKDHVDTIKSRNLLDHVLRAQNISEPLRLLKMDRAPANSIGSPYRFTNPEQRGVLGSTCLPKDLQLVAISGIEVNKKRWDQIHSYGIENCSQRASHTNSSSTPMADRTNNLTGVLSSMFEDNRANRSTYTNSEICAIASLSKRLSNSWGRVPRIYVTLRTIGCLNFLDDFIDLGFSDSWFPVTERMFPLSLRPSQKANFIKAQSLVLTKSMDLEKGSHGRHCYFGQGEVPPLERQAILGTGGSGEVDKILSLTSYREYARKRVARSIVFGRRKTETLKLFVAEIEVLKRLQHRHVVEFVGSYSDGKYLALTMYPVAEMDLTTYLKRSNVLNSQELRTFCGCLATAVDFLLGQNVRHKDTKPANVLVDRGNVMLTDFGLSLDFTDADGSTTISMVNGMTLDTAHRGSQHTNLETRRRISGI